MNQILKAFELNEVDALILGVTEDYTLDSVSETLSLFLNHEKERGSFEGKIGQSTYFTVVIDGKPLEVAAIGLGSEESFTRIKFKNTLATAFKTLKTKKIRFIGVDMDAVFDVYDSSKRVSKMISETLILANYEFDTYKTDRKESVLEAVWINPENLESEAFDEGVLLGESTLFARYLVNEPANVMTPSRLADDVVKMGVETGLEVEVKGKEEILDLNMHAFWAVAKASTEEPKLIVMRYTGNPDSDQRLGLVGKGLTYDSGGLSIKPTNGMVTMKCDMGGAAAVIGAMRAIASAGLKANVTAVVAACENMISGVSYKPGDIISSMGGKSIFIGNTDAEGRLTLVDAVTYIQEHEQVTSVVDIATLTGAAIHCLGSNGTPMIANNDGFFSKVERAFDKADENAWRMPIFDEFKELIKHEYADLTNTACSPGTITAGMFIGEFVKDKPWVHIDIAGTAFTDKNKGILSKGGTGVGVRPLYYLAKKLGK